MQRMATFPSQRSWRFTVTFPSLRGSPDWIAMRILETSGTQEVETEETAEDPDEVPEPVEDHELVELEDVNVEEKEKTDEDEESDDGKRGKPGVPKIGAPESKPRVRRAVCQFSFTFHAPKRLIRSMLAFGPPPEGLSPANGTPIPSSISSMSVLPAS